jgi:hypothetical protein
MAKLEKGVRYLRLQNSAMAFHRVYIGHLAHTRPFQGCERNSEIAR